MNQPTRPLFVPANVLRVLGRYASERWQLRWMVTGAGDELVLASELIKDVNHITAWSVRTNTSPRVLAIMHRFLAKFYECVERMPVEVDVRSNEDWLELREAAGRALAELGRQVPADPDAA